MMYRFSILSNQQPIVADLQCFHLFQKKLEEIVVPDSLRFMINGYLLVIFDNPAPHRLITLYSPQALISLSMFRLYFNCLCFMLFQKLLKSLFL